MKNARRILSTLSIISILIAFSQFAYCKAFAISGSEDTAIKQGETGVLIGEKYSYEDYLKDNKSELATEKVDINILNFRTFEENAEIKSGLGDFEGEYVLTKESGKTAWMFEIPQDGYYNLEVSYYPVKGKGVSIVRKITVDGELPFDEARNINFPRIWSNVDDKIQKDEYGNDIRPVQAESPRWETLRIRDNVGLYNEPLMIYFSKGHIP